MNALKQLRAPLVVIVGVAFLTTAGCAGTEPKETNTGTGGVGGVGGAGPPPINGLESLTVAPTNATVTLTAAAAGTLTSTAQKFTATGVVFGETKDVSAMVGWSADLKGVVIDGTGNATATSPGIYTITAKSGSFQASATLNATFSGAIFDPELQPDQQQQDVLDGATSGPTTIMYPVDHALFPSNLTPIYAQMTAPGASAIARLNFQATGLDINYYANCVAIDDTNNNDPLPGAGCYVKMPLTLTQLFIATSEREDIKMTARVSSGGGAGRVAADQRGVGQRRAVGWHLLLVDDPEPAQGDDGERAGAAAELRPARSDRDQRDRDLPLRLHQRDAGADGHLDRRRRAEEQPALPGCARRGEQQRRQGALHRLPRDQQRRQVHGAHDRGSRRSMAANTAMLDIGQQSLININPSASTDPNSSPTMNWSDYWKRFRVEGTAAENTWGPNNDRMVSMFRSKLYLTAVTITGTTGTATRMGPVSRPGRSCTRRIRSGARTAAVRVHLVRPARTSASTTPTG